MADDREDEADTTEGDAAAANTSTCISTNEVPAINDTPAQIETARSLLFGSFGGILSTLSQELAGHPFGSLVPYCLDYSGQPILLLSHLSQHTRNLEADPRVALTLTEARRGDLQTQARLTCVAEAQPADGEYTTMQRRYFRYFPDTQLYYEQLNFRFYRLHPLRFYFVGGFGAARWFGPYRLLASNPLSADVEGPLLQHLSRNHIDALSRLPTVRDLDADARWSVVGVDGLGLDLRGDQQLLRIPLTEPISHPDQALAVLNSMVEDM